MKQPEDIHNSGLVAALDEAPDKPVTVAMLREACLALELDIIKAVKASEDRVMREMGKLDDRLSNSFFWAALTISAAILAVFLKTG